MRCWLWDGLKLKLPRFELMKLMVRLPFQIKTILGREKMRLSV